MSCAAAPGQEPFARSRVASTERATFKADATCSVLCGSSYCLQDSKHPVSACWQICSCCGLAAAHCAKVPLQAFLQAGDRLGTTALTAGNTGGAAVVVGADVLAVGAVALAVGAATGDDVVAPVAVLPLAPACAATRPVGVAGCAGRAGDVGVALAAAGVFTLNTGGGGGVATALIGGGGTSSSFFLNRLQPHAATIANQSNFSESALNCGCRLPMTGTLSEIPLLFAKRNTVGHEDRAETLEAMRKHLHSASAMAHPMWT
jgi:hypothetical protein